MLSTASRSENQLTVRDTTASQSTAGSQPMSVFAREMSAGVPRMSPSRLGTANVTTGPPHHQRHRRGAQLDDPVDPLHRPRLPQPRELQDRDLLPLREARPLSTLKPEEPHFLGADLDFRGADLRRHL